MSRNPKGLLLLRDELAGWLKTLEADGHEGDREFYLESWNGTGSFTVDRIKRGTVRIEGLCLSIVGGIQPGKLGAYIDRAISGKQGADGLLQRLQVVVWPDRLTEWKKATNRPNAQAIERAFAVFQRLDCLDFEPDQEGEIPYLRFDPEAQSLFDDWRHELENRIRGDELRNTPAFEAHLSKYRSLIPSLALLFHLVHQHGRDVCVECAGLAAGWCEYLEHHARKIYSEELQPGVAGAHLLAHKIKQGAVQDGSRVRDIYRHHWSKLTNPENVWGSVEVLSAAGWVRVENFQTEGRNAEIIRLHRELGGKTDAQGEPSWKKFYPDLASADFEITKTTGGVAGRKIRGTMVGTVGFFIPWTILEKGPPPPANEGNSSMLHIPSQTNPGKVDVWRCGARVDPPQLKFWFVKTVEKEWT